MQAEATAREWWAGRPLAETRWMLELTRLVVDPVFRSRDGIPRGDGRPVVLLPGFIAGDQTLAVMATWLYRLGYSPQMCGFVGNIDCSQRALERVERKVASLHRRHRRRVAVIGHSRGGHFARALGAWRPERVSHAISLGADLQQMLDVSTPTLLAVGATRRALRLTGRAGAKGCLTEDCECEFTSHYADVFPVDAVRLTSIYTKGDGVVRWQRCLVPEADCIEVDGSHTGLIFNRSAYRAIGFALAAPELGGPA
ncbi:MAG TPA: alpha/beta hydrolase [Candidatus Dormibacteraeota bacterium]|nr:alpha/beta hydrolase [Candidatus Dormibacteraeota bacterium]